MDEYKFDISDRSSRNSCICSGTGAQACGQRGAGISCQSVRTDPSAFVGDPLYAGYDGKLLPEDHWGDMITLLQNKGITCERISFML